MGRKRREYVMGANEMFYVVTMDNGKTSPAFNEKQEALDWLDEHWVNTDNHVSQLTVKRKYRKSLLLREAERQSEIAVLEKRLTFLKEMPSVAANGGREAM